MREKQTIVPTKGLVDLKLLTRNARLREARAEKGFTQKDLSLITGISLAYIQEIENLQRVPSREEMEEIASALKKPVEFLFPLALMRAVKARVFRKLKAKMECITFTEAKRLGYPLLALTSEIAEVKRKRVLLEGQIKEVMMASLTPREQKVLILRFGLEGGSMKTFKEVGEEFGLSKERIRQIEARALRKLRHPNITRKLRVFLD